MIGIEKIRTFRNLDQLYESSFCPDLLLCDIQFSEHTALQQIFNIPGNIPVIWVSAYPQYMVKAFSPRSFGFVDKANLRKNLREALDNASKFLKQIPTVEFQAFYERITVPQNRIEMIQIEDSRIYLYMFCEHKTVILTENNLKCCYDKLNQDSFYLANRSCIVNLSGIISVDEEFHEITMSSGKKVKIPRRRWPEFKERYLWII